MTQGDIWYYLPVNPEPWTVGSVYTGRKNGKVFGGITKDHGLVAFQEAIKEELINQGAKQQPSGEYTLKFFLWRQREQYSSPKDGRTVTKKQADATNMQKAIEDALQGVLFDNDRSMRAVHSTIVEQSVETQGGIALRLRPWVAFNPDFVPDHIWQKRDEHVGNNEQIPIDWTPGEDIF